MSVGADSQAINFSKQKLSNLLGKLNSIVASSEYERDDVRDNIDKYFWLYKNIKLNLDQITADRNLIDDLERFVDERTPKDGKVRSKEHEKEIADMQKRYSEDIRLIIEAQEKWKKDYTDWIPNRRGKFLGNPTVFNKVMRSFPVYKRNIVPKDELPNKKDLAIKEAEQFYLEYKKLKNEIDSGDKRYSEFTRQSEYGFTDFIEMVNKNKFDVNSIGELKPDDNKIYLGKREIIRGTLEQFKGILKEIKAAKAKAEIASRTEPKPAAEAAGQPVMRAAGGPLQSRVQGQPASQRASVQAEVATRAEPKPAAEAAGQPVIRAAGDPLQSRAQEQPASQPRNPSLAPQTVVPLVQHPSQAAAVQDTAASRVQTGPSASSPGATPAMGTSSSVFQDRFQNMERSSSAQQQTVASSQNVGAYTAFEQNKEQEKLKGLYKTLGNVSFQGNPKVDEANYKNIRNETTNTINALIKENPEIYQGIKHKISSTENSDTITIGDVEIRREFKKNENTQKDSVNISMSLPLTDSALLLMIKTNTGALPLVMKTCNDPSVAIKVFQASLVSNSAVKLDKADTELLRNSEFSSMIPPDNKLEEYAKKFKEFYDVKVSAGTPYAFGEPLPDSLSAAPPPSSPTNRGLRS